MLYPHHDGPEGVVPIDRQREWKSLDHMIDHGTDLVAVGLNFGNAWPIIIVVIQIIPRLFIDADGEYRLKMWVDAFLYDLGDDQFVDVKNRVCPK